MLERLPAGVFGSGAFARRWAKLGYLFEGTDEQFLLRAFEFNKRDMALACLSPDVAARAGAAGAGFLETGLARSCGRSLVDRMLHLELLGFLPDHNLNYTDKAAMAQSVEVRVPFLDTDLFAEAARIPWQLKTRGLTEKWVLKQAFTGRLPRSILYRKKTGFGAPVRTWFKRGQLKTLAADILGSRQFRERGLFDVAATKALLEESGKQDSSYLFALMAFNVGAGILSPSDSRRQLWMQRSFRIG